MQALNGPPRFRVFAVEDTAVQVCWTAGGGGELTLEAGPTSVNLTLSGGPGAAVLDGLPPATPLELIVTNAGGRRRLAESFSTLPSPPGRLLSRLATINDMHIGSHSFGTLHPIWEEGDLEPHALRCARAAISEAREWGAGLLVVKGDLTQDGRPAEWDKAGSLIAGCGIPAAVIEGNHDVNAKAVDGAAIMGRHGVALCQRPTALDVPGARVVLFPTAGWHTSEGMLEAGHVSAAIELIAGAPGPSIVALHHYPQRFRLPTMYPSGIPGPAAASFLNALAEANPATVVLTGHSHRHRRHHHGPLVVAEVGSTKDYPGSWAGYAIHEGGIRQVTRRVAAPDAMAWTERGRSVMGGVWSVWAPGMRSHRCFTHSWPSR